MFNPLQGAGAMKKMWDMQRALQREEMTVEKNGVKVVISGDQKVKTVQSNGRSDNDIKEAVNEAFKQSQQVAAKKLQEMGGGLQGLLGGMK